MNDKAQRAPGCTSSRTRHWMMICFAASRVALALGAGALTLLVLEVGIRVSGIADHLYTDPAFEMSPRGNYWVYRPGFQGTVHGPTRVRIGPFGSRLHGPSNAGFSAGRVLVAIFGDSFTFGQGVDEALTFPARIEELLRAENLPVDVFNFGVQGHTLEMELAHLEDRLGQIHPQVVVWAILSNDMDP